MTRDEIDILWHQAMNQAVKDGEMFTRYEFAKLVAASEREAIESALTDPENQPSQWGTVAIEHMEQQVAAEREACAKVCSGRAMKCESEAQRAIENGEHDEVSAIRSTAWQISVCAAATRARSKE